MTARFPHILLLEPYFGGSHRAFLTGLQESAACTFTLLTLPARKWKMRMQLAAPWLAERITALVAAGNRFDGILSSTFVDGAVLRSQLCQAGIHLPLAIYFHENQFSYPGQVADPGRHQFTAINFNTALAADRLAFNSRYNLDTFFDGVRRYLKKAADMDVRHLADTIAAGSIVLHPGVDFTAIDRAPGREELPGRSPVIVWNHRWEHDKDPETFFRALFRLAGRGLPFRLVVLGQHFRHQPPIFAEARQRLADRILHFGFVVDREGYAALLRRGDIVVSTARHEFFGISVLEAVRAGCRPLVPDRLAYRELFPDRYRYREGGLVTALERLLTRPHRLSRATAAELTARFSWPEVAPAYDAWLAELCRGGQARRQEEKDPGTPSLPTRTARRHADFPEPGRSAGQFHQPGGR